MSQEEITFRYACNTIKTFVMSPDACYEATQKHGWLQSRPELRTVNK